VLKSHLPFSLQRASSTAQVNHLGFSHPRHTASQDAQNPHKPDT